MTPKFIIQVLDFMAGRYLAYRGLQHLRAGCPPVAAFAFDHIGHEINLKGRHEAADLELTFKFLAERGLIAGDAVDVGANVGNHSLFLARYYDRVVSLEPNPRAFELLVFNAKLNDRVRSLNIAASDVDEAAALVFEPHHWGGARLIGATNGMNSAGTVRVLARRLDELEELSSRAVGLIKIDVEGHELRVLNGAARLIARSRPVIVFEQHAEGIAGGSSDVVEWLRENGYSQFFEVQSFPAVPRGWRFPGRRAINGLLRLAAGERKRVVRIARFERALHPMVIAVPAR